MKKMHKDIIIVEDDLALRENICELLKLDEFDVTDCGSAKEFLDHINTNQFKVAIVDVGLPDQSGYDLARYLRTNTDMGIIILTARTGIDNKIQGFSSGADYYFSKPVDSRELAAAINNLMCRLSFTDQSEENTPQKASWTLISNGWLLISPNGIEIRLTTKESEFIRLLQKCEKDGVQKEYILQELGYLSEEPYGSRALGVMVTRLRKKIKNQVGENQLIKTIHGFGFLMGETLLFY